MILITILVFSFAMLLHSSAAATTNNSPQTTQNELQKDLDNFYLKELGFYSNVTVINSAASIAGNAKTTGSGGFTYQSKFSSGNKTSTVQVSWQETISKATTTTISDERISGSKNSHYTSKEINMTSGNIVTTQRTLSMQDVNTTGSYNFNLISQTLTQLSNGKLISGTAQVDQNRYPIIGSFNETITPQNNAIDYVISLPNGSYSTFNLYQGPPSQALDSQTSKSNIVASGNNVVTPDDIIPWVTDHGVDTVYAAQNNLNLQCDRYWWLPTYNGFNWLYWSVASLIAGCVGGGIPGAIIAGVVFGIQSYVLYQAGNYESYMDPYGVYIMYSTWETKNVNFLGFNIKLPYAWETGYYTNYVIINNINTYTDWYYYPLDTVCFGHLSWTGTYNEKHSDVWSLDPPADATVTFLAYDQSSSSYVANVPICIDNQWIPSSVYASVPEEAHCLNAADANGGGAFNCFFDGSNYYGNSPTITISGDTTITAYYYYIPTYTVTVYASCGGSYDLYPNVYVDGNWVGTAPATFQVALGFHTITLDNPTTDTYFGYGDDYYSCMYDQNNVMYNCDPQSLPIYASGSTLTAYYNPWYQY